MNIISFFYIIIIIHDYIFMIIAKIKNVASKGYCELC